MVVIRNSASLLLPHNVVEICKWKQIMYLSQVKNWYLIPTASWRSALQKSSDLLKVDLLSYSTSAWCCQSQLHRPTSKVPLPVVRHFRRLKRFPALLVTRRRSQWKSGKRIYIFSHSVCPEFSTSLPRHIVFQAKMILFFVSSYFLVSDLLKWMRIAFQILLLYAWKMVIYY